MADRNIIIIQELRNELAVWRGRAVEAAAMACFNCEEYVKKRPEVCNRCRIKKIWVEAGEEWKDTK